MYDAICEIDGKKYGSFIVCPIGRGRPDQLEKLRSDLIAAAVDTLLDRGILKIEETPTADGCTIMQVKLWVLKEIMKDWKEEVEIDGVRYGVVGCSAVAGYASESDAANDSEFEQTYKDAMFELLKERGALTVTDEKDASGRVHRTWHLKVLKKI